MTTNIPAKSAQIFQFPPRGRFALNARDNVAGAALEGKQPVRVVCSGWYHEAAIEEERARRN